MFQKPKNKTKTKINQRQRQNLRLRRRKTNKKPEVIRHIPLVPPEKSDVKGCVNQHIKPLNCSPAVAGKTAMTGTCFTPNVLMDIKTNFNRIYPDKKIVSTDPREIWQKLHDDIVDCKDEVCWLNVIKDPNERNKIQKTIFAPTQPADWADNPDEWLSNYDIFHVIRQYEETYPDFEFIGPTTIDFDEKPEDMNGNCVEEELCKISLKSLIAKNKTKIGVVFNLDKHTEDGSHWVSLYVDMTEGVIFFFDSSAGGLPTEIRKLVNRLIKESSSSVISSNTRLKLPLKLYNNGNFRHQYSSTECGMYSLFFIITMLTGKTKFTGENVVMPMKDRIRLFLKKKIPDKVVSDYRDLYFNHLPKKG